MHGDAAPRGIRAQHAELLRSISLILQPERGGDERGGDEAKGGMLGLLTALAGAPQPRPAVAAHEGSQSAAESDDFLSVEGSEQLEEEANLHAVAPQDAEAEPLLPPLPRAALAALGALPPPPPLLGGGAEETEAEKEGAAGSIGGSGGAAEEEHGLASEEARMDGDTEWTWTAPSTGVPRLVRNLLKEEQLQRLLLQVADGGQEGGGAASPGAPWPSAGRDAGVSAAACGGSGRVPGGPRVAWGLEGKLPA